MLASSVPPDLSPAAGTFLISLQPNWQPVQIDESLSFLQLPASHLLASLGLNVSAGQQQQQSLQERRQALLPAPGASCAVDLQLVVVSVQDHPLGQGQGWVGAVQRLSNVIEGGATLQAQPDGNNYR
jgi:hypothetical protein